VWTLPGSYASSWSLRRLRVRNLFAQQRGQAWSYAPVYDLVMRLHKRLGYEFDPHWMRHAAATRWLRDGVIVVLRGNDHYGDEAELCQSDQVVSMYCSPAPGVRRSSLRSGIRCLL
jgi:hypothetical protein